MARTLTARPAGSASSESETLTSPPVRVPVTTVPEPLAAKTRSIHSRGRPRSAAGGAATSRSSRAAVRSSAPIPATMSTGTTGASARKVPAVRSATSSRASSIRSSSAWPTLVSATSPRSTPSSSRMRRCSSDWGFQPSVAATANRQASTPLTPASMFFRKRTWPGTSMKAAPRPDGSVIDANPRSMVRPRCFSSSRRSGSVPVRARTMVLLP